MRKLATLFQAFKPVCEHDWKCSNRNEDMLRVDASTVRFKCSKCGKEEGL